MGVSVLLCMLKWKWSAKQRPERSFSRNTRPAAVGTDSELNGRYDESV